MIVVTMTSYPKRINNCCRVLKTILDQSVKADRIYFNLAEVEFPKKEKDLPADLVKLIKENKSIILKWVKGENTKSMKKVFPILEEPGLTDDTIIMHTDDDLLLPKDLIKSRLEDLTRNHFDCPISGFVLKDNRLSGAVVGPTTMYTKAMLKNWQKFLTKDVIHTYHDDRTYKWIFWLNGYEVISCSQYCIGWDAKRIHIEHIADNNGLTANNGYTKAKQFDDLATKIVSKWVKFENINQIKGYLKTGKLAKYTEERATYMSGYWGL